MGQAIKNGNRIVACTLGVRQFHADVQDSHGNVTDRNISKEML